MRLLVHDYSGHPFQVELSRALAGRGHEVHHFYASFFQTPKGPLARRDRDPPNFHIAGHDLGEPFAKYSFLKRVRQEIAYGRLMAREVVRLKPDVVISSNMPLDPQARLLRACRATDAAFVFWLQDIYAVAIDRILSRRLPIAGAAIGARYKRLERRLLRDADCVVAITADFLPIIDQWRVERGRIEVVENWAPLAEMPVRPRRNAWSTEHGLDDKLVFLYSGTLGLKHNPALLLGLAHRLGARPDARVVVVSEGPGADWLAAHKVALPADNLLLLPFQPFARMPDVLGGADALLAVLEAEAGVFSVPSKVLTYMCAARPILAAMPEENLAARTLLRSGAGLVVGPDDEAGFCAAAERLADDAELRARLGSAGRAHAESHFRIDEIATRFQRICARAKGIDR
jgi:glycosyltransferase involved in cell wall biosynthesis